MKKSRFTEAQVISILKEADAGVAVKDIRRYFFFCCSEAALTGSSTFQVGLG